MAVAVGRIGHEDRLTVVDHLEELRPRPLASWRRWRSRSA